MQFRHGGSFFARAVGVACGVDAAGDGSVDAAAGGLVDMADDDDCFIGFFVGHYGRVPSFGWPLAVFQMDFSFHSKAENRRPILPSDCTLV